MAVVFDACVLIDLFNPHLKGDRKPKLDYLVKTLEKERTKILIPTPALTELMIKAGKAREEYQRILSSRSVFKIEPFDSRAAMECAFLLAEAWTAKDQRNVGKVKFKFDWQIVAIASSRSAQAIYSDDNDIAQYAKRVNIPVYKTDDLPLPDAERQQEIPFE